jgi:predicted nuclease of predicted toxin-antitoxin system
MKIVVDMCLPPSWVEILQRAGYEAIHWKNIGEYHAADTEILKWARENDYIIFTHDLDFGTLLALTNATGPSVIQARTQDVTPDHLSQLIISYMRLYETHPSNGALMVVDEARARVTLLPLLTNN